MKTLMTIMELLFYRASVNGWNGVTNNVKFILYVRTIFRNQDSLAPKPLYMYW